MDDKRLRDEITTALDGCIDFLDWGDEAVDDVMAVIEPEIRRLRGMVDGLLSFYDPWQMGQPCQWCNQYKVDGHREECGYQKAMQVRDWGPEEGDDA